MYTYIHTVNNSNATQLQSSSGWRGPSFLLGWDSWESPGVEAALHHPQHSARRSSKVWRCDRDTKPARWGESCWVTKGWGLWEIACLVNLEKWGHTLRGSHTWWSREVNGVRLNSLPEGLSPFFQSWESSEIKGLKGKSTSLDTQGVFHTTLSFPCQQTQPQPPLNESLHVQIPVLAWTLQMQGAKWKKGPGLGEK